MEADIIISIAIAITVVVAIHQIARLIRTFAMHRTIREALLRGSTLTPELLAGMEETVAPRRGGDDRTGIQARRPIGRTSAMTDQIAHLLASLLATPQRPPDEGFVRHTQALVRFEQRRQASRRAVFSRAALEAAAAGAMLLAFAGAARIGEASDIVPLFSPAMAGLIALGLWCAVSLAAPARSKARG